MVETRIYGIIGADVTSTTIADELAAIDGTPDLTVRINSRGGDAFDGVAILNVLRGYGGRVTTIVDGLAASAASFIAMAGAEIVMNRNSEMMIHNGHALAVGGADDMRKVADNLERVNANIASIYAERAGGSVEDWRALMADETWFTAEEAVAAGLADRVESIKGHDANKVKAFFDLSIFNHAGRSHAPAPRIPQAHTETPRNPEAEKGKEATMATLSESALQKLGLDADADEDAINEAIEKFAAPEPTEAPEPTIEEAAKVAAKFGQKLVNVAQFDQMAASVADLEARRDAAVKAENETAITNALSTGRIDAASADTWRAELGKNREGTLALLNTLPANKAVPVDEIGHGVHREENLDAEMSTVYAQVTGKTYGKDA
ncbi:Gp4 [uncultured Mycobacterium sp.]|uniref:ATP-dependent Clp protease proteolytic subunit n=1 Tax=uncultured Mycobacterium sp. TaxID=171292 RepID=A0A1Y5P8F6_9MYCO|nr:Gp4 [uncultured Mycobacterium sp.]